MIFVFPPVIALEVGTWLGLFASSTKPVTVQFKLACNLRTYYIHAPALPFLFVFIRWENMSIFRQSAGEVLVHPHLPHRHSFWVAPSSFSAYRVRRSFSSFQIPQCLFHS
ncbi:hypothetical protein QBC32DRAFT_171212 [Pseudoneurospora amorphoporcata]|uniref:Uncharacterized protein n=1 Tax=Pseudoneurospora amorphoporcata TaxID=241081 RepID=A0AAN6SFF6_9PEZI|nr:hypothetical protein QBC32DRAFT_171212 [Pseudoneurospora amorphoporcata]